MTLEFLEKIGALNMDFYRIDSLNTSTVPMPVSGNFQTIVRVVFGNKGNKFAALITFIDGKFWTYKLNLLSGEMEGSEQSLESCLAIARSAINGYQTCLNANYCSKFSQMVSTALTTKSLIIEDDTALLKIYHEEDLQSLEQTMAQCFYKIDGKFITPYRSVQISLSKTGLVTRLYDGMGLHRVATTDVKISREEAINLAVPYIIAYAKRHQQKVKEINATLEYVSDITSNRGDRFAIYPQWNVFATFDIINEENVFSYSVLMWADNGKVHHDDPQGSIQNSISDSPNLFPLLIAIIIVVFIFPGLGAYTMRRVKIRRKHR